MTKKIRPINWNKAPENERTIWAKLTENFWLPEKVPLSNDIKSWGTLSEEEKLVTKKVFTGLTQLDTIQGTIGAVELLKDAANPFQEAIYANMAFMEHVHAKSYSSIFSTLCSTEEIDDIFEWAENDEMLQAKAELIQKYYEDPDPLKKKIASTALEGAMFYSGFYLPLYWSSKAKLTNTADLIRLIIRDEAVHAYMIGLWYQEALTELSTEEKDEYKAFAFDLFQDVYELEAMYTENLYDPLGLTEKVKTFVRFNINKALSNLGYEAMFPSNTTQVEALILSALSPNSDENHDFFSGSGASYIIGKKIETDDDDWDF